MALSGALMALCFSCTSPETDTFPSRIDGSAFDAADASDSRISDGADADASSGDAEDAAFDGTDADAGTGVLDSNTEETGAQQCWTQRSGCVQTLAGDWVIGCAVAGTPGNYEVLQFDRLNAEYVKRPGAGVTITLAPSATPWIVNAEGSVFQWDGADFVELKSTLCEAGPPACVRARLGDATLAVGAGELAWVIDCEERWGGGRVLNWAPGCWQESIGSVGTQVTISARGKAWVINDLDDFGGRKQVWLEGDEGFSGPFGEASSISAATNVYSLHRGKVRRWASDDWVPVASAPEDTTQLYVSPSEELFALANEAVYVYTCSGARVAD